MRPMWWHKTLLCILLLFTCSTAFAEEDSTTTDEFSKIRNLIEIWTSAFNIHDVDSISKLFSGNATFINVYGDLMLGQKEIRQEREAMHKGHFQGTKMTTTIKKYHFVAPSVAVVIVDWTLEAPAVGTFLARSSLVLIKESDEWKVVAFQNTPVNPPEWRQAEKTGTLKDPPTQP